MSTSIGLKAQRPNPALSAFSFLIGEWLTEGTHPQMSGQVLRGRTSFAWHEGGAFLMMRSEVDHPDFPDGVAIVGSDGEAGRLAMNYFDQRGVSRLIQVEVSERKVTWRHDSPTLAQSLTITAEGENRLVSQGRMSQNGGAWGDDLSQVFTRVEV